MKKLFLGITYIVLVVVLFVYLLIPCVKVPSTNSQGYVEQAIITNSVDTGLPILGLVFIFPTAVFSILSLTMNKAMITFLKFVFGLFMGVFILAASIVVLTRSFYDIYSLFVPIILIVAAVCSTVIAVFGIIEGITSDNLIKRNNSNEEQNAE